MGETEEGRDPSDKEEFVGVREIEEWDDSSSSDDSHHSSDMELSDDPGDEGQLFLEVGKGYVLYIHWPLTYLAYCSGCR